MRISPAIFLFFSTLIYSANQSINYCDYSQIVDELIGSTFTDNEGNTMPITENEILVVAPYNMQVNLLKQGLDDRLKIGTIDKFQGQEAPVVIISMASSDVNESARGIDFLFDTHRLNVAISRAKALAIIVHREGLEQCSVSSVSQILKVNMFCRLVKDGR